MKKTKIIFLIHDLSVGGAEKVLVNLVNNMDQTRFDITVMALFDGGVNRHFLKQHIKYKACFKKPFPGNSQIMKLISPRYLHRLFIKEQYDIEISYLEGPTARIVSGCQNQETKLVSWIHCKQYTPKSAAYAFRSFKESKLCYQRFDCTVCVSEGVKEDFQGLYNLSKPVVVLYNTNESQMIQEKAQEFIEDCKFSEKTTNVIAVGRIIQVKGFDRLARIQKRFCEEGYNVHTYILGVGDMQKEIQQYVNDNRIADCFTFLGYKTNPYKYIARCDLFVCSSYSEGFSTAATEALIVGTPVCTVDVSGMKELLGMNNEYGIVVPNQEEELYEGIKKFVLNSELLQRYKKQAQLRSEDFSTELTVKSVEDMLLKL